MGILSPVQPTSPRVKWRADVIAPQSQRPTATMADSHRNDIVSANFIKELGQPLTVAHRCVLYRNYETIANGQSNDWIIQSSHVYQSNDLFTGLANRLNINS